MGNELTYVGVGTANGALVFRENREAQHWDMVVHGLYGHKVACVVGHPDGTIYAGAVNGTVYSTRDWEHWTPLFEGLKYTNVRALALDPDEPNTIYAGTCPAAVFKSTDRGRTWKHLESHRQVEGSDGWSHPEPPYSPYIGRLFRLPNRPGTIFSSIAMGGVVASFDGGQTWESRQNGLPRQITDLSYHPGAPDRLYATTILGFYRSDDLGKSWTNLVSGLPWLTAVCLAVDPLDPDRVIISVTRPDTRIGTLFRSDNGGLHWDVIPANLPLLGQSAITSLTASGGYFFAGSAGGHLYGSRDGSAWAPLRPQLPAIYSVTPIQGQPVQQVPTP